MPIQNTVGYKYYVYHQKTTEVILPPSYGMKVQMPKPVLGRDSIVIFEVGEIVKLRAERIKLSK